MRPGRVVRLMRTGRVVRPGNAKLWRHGRPCPRRLRSRWLGRGRMSAVGVSARRLRAGYLRRSGLVRLGDVVRLRRLLLGIGCTRSGRISSGCMSISRVIERSGNWVLSCGGRLSRCVASRAGSWLRTIVVWLPREGRLALTAERVFIHESILRPQPVSYLCNWFECATSTSWIDRWTSRCRSTESGYQESSVTH